MYALSVAGMVKKNHQNYNWAIKWGFIIQHKRYDLSQKKKREKKDQHFQIKLKYALEALADIMPLFILLHVTSTLI